MKEKNFKSNGLVPANFSDTGRGMMAKKTYQEGDTLISLPCQILIGTKKALQASKWAQFMLSSSKMPRFTSLQILCVFLMEGKYKLDNGFKFDWDVYIKTLPKTFHFHHVFWDAKDIKLLPKTIQKKVKLLHEKIRSDYIAVKDVFDSYCGQEKFALLWDAYRWAWCCVNTRCIYSNHEELSIKNILKSPSDYYYLAPYLDLFNHSFSAKVNGFYNQISKAYEINTLQRWNKFEQIFISYGPHSTEDLFLEYGFIVPGQNPNDTFNVSLDNILSVTMKLKTLCSKCRKTLTFILNSHYINKDWSLSYSGLSYNLSCTILIISKLYFLIDKSNFCKNPKSCLIILQQEKQLSSFITEIHDGKIPFIILSYANEIKTNLIKNMKSEFLDEFKEVSDKIIEDKNKERYQTISDLYQVTFNIFEAAMLHNIEEAFGH
ncbi:SET domain-containing protein 4-like isoform X2 [Styela clava]|nr:SET domain-containing protein 4-like isoform X2 [Styela clava]